MNKTTLLTIAVIGLLLLNGAFVSMHFFRKPPLPPTPAIMPPPMKDHARNFIIEKLHFDSVQVKQYDTLIQQHRKNIREAEQTFRELKNKLYETLNGDGSGSADSIMSRIAATQQKIEAIHYNHFAEIKKLCRPEQLKYFDELTSELVRLFTPPPPGGMPPPGERPQEKNN